MEPHLLESHSKKRFSRSNSRILTPGLTIEFRGQHDPRVVAYRRLSTDLGPLQSASNPPGAPYSLAVWIKGVIAQLSADEALAFSQCFPSPIVANNDHYPLQPAPDEHVVSKLLRLKGRHLSR